MAHLTAMMTPIADQLVAAQARIVQQDYKHSLMAGKWFMSNQELAAANDRIDGLVDKYGGHVHAKNEAERQLAVVQTQLDIANAKIAELEGAVTEATRDD